MFFICDLGYNFYYEQTDLYFYYMHLHGMFFYFYRHSDRTAVISD